MAVTFKKAQIPAVSLYTSLSGAGTSMTITPLLKDLDGNVITMAALQSNPQLTIDPKVAGYEEIIGFTGITNNGDGTMTLTGLTRDLASSSLATPGTGKQHGAGAIVVLSLNPQDIARIAALENDQTFTGINTFSQSPVVPAPTNNLQAATKKYVDDIVSTGTPDASTVTKGKVLMSVSPVSAGSPIAVGDNDTRVPTSGQAAALAGTNGTPNGTTNKYVTATDTTLTGAEQTSNKDTTTTLGTSDTKYPSQNAVKTYVDTQDATNLTIAENWVLQSVIPIVSSANLRWSDNATVNVVNSTYTKYKEIQVNEPLVGTITVKADIGTSLATVFYKLYKNGVAFGAEQTAAVTATCTDTVTVNLVSGDKLQAYCHGTTGSPYVLNFRLYFDRAPITTFVTNPTNNS